MSVDGGKDEADAVYNPGGVVIIVCYHHEIMLCATK